MVVLEDSKLKPGPEAFLVAVAVALALVVGVGEELDRRQVIQKLFGQRLNDVSYCKSRNSHGLNTHRTLEPQLCGDGSVLG